MTKEEYIESLDEIVNDQIFITNQTNLLDEEISKNCWSISAEQVIIDQLSVKDLAEVIKLIKDNRTKQLSECELEIELIFYMWFDEQAAQLRFNLINSNHQELPFGAKVNFVNSEDAIIDEFLSDENHNGIPFSELEEIKKYETGEYLDKQILEPFVLNVYKERIRK